MRPIGVGSIILTSNQIISVANNNSYIANLFAVFGISSLELCSYPVRDIKRLESGKTVIIIDYDHIVNISIQKILSVIGETDDKKIKNAINDIQNNNCHAFINNIINIEDAHKFIDKKIKNINILDFIMNLKVTPDNYKKMIDNIEKFDIIKNLEDVPESTAKMHLVRYKGNLKRMLKKIEETKKE